MQNLLTFMGVSKSCTQVDNVHPNNVDVLANFLQRTQAYSKL